MSAMSAHRHAKRIFKRPYFYDKGALIFYNIIGIDYGISFYIRIGV